MTALEIGLDWVIVGGPYEEGGVMILASKDLSDVMLTAEFAHPPRGLLLEKSRVRTTMTVRLEHYTIFLGPDYPSVFKHMTENWSPEPDPGPELDLRKALPC